MHFLIRNYWLKHHKLYQQLEGLCVQISEKEMEYRLTPDSWSIKQIIHHLSIAEKASVNLILDFDFNKKSEKLGFREKWSCFLLKMALLSPLKFKAPGKLGDYTNEMHESTDMILKSWKENNERFERFLKDFPELKLNDYIYKHPRAGKLTILQALGFFNWHIIHHNKQIRKICDKYRISYNLRS